MSRGYIPYSILFKEGNTVANKNNATCCICGREYHKCLSCKDSMKLQPWKDVTDTAECYKVFQVVKGYSTGVYTKEEFKLKLKNIDLSDLDNFRDNIKVIIKDALKEDKPVKMVYAEESPIVEPVAIEKVAAHRKRNYKVEE